MDYVVLGAVVPHPPIILPEIGGGEEEKIRQTSLALQKLVQKISQLEVDTLIFISSHGPVFQDAIVINGSAQLAGDFSQFGHGEVKLEMPADLPLAQSIVESANQQGITTALLDATLAEELEVSLELDHGVLVPLYFFQQQAVKLPMVSITMGLLAYEELYAFGRAVQMAAENLGKKVVVIASGDLSHRLLPDAPAGYNPAGKEFDDQIVAGINGSSVENILGISAACIQGAGECGMRPIIMMLGSLDGFRWEGHVEAYEGPFGVGYMVAWLQPGAKRTSLVEELYQARKQSQESLRATESPLVKLAREALEAYVKSGRKITSPEGLTAEMQEEAGVFVSLKKFGQLRGCIGTIGPTQVNVAEEIIYNAIQAGTQDPRFFPVEAEELTDLVYSVDVLRAPEPIERIEELDVHKYGVIVTSGTKRGLLLPNLDGVDTVQEQVRIAKEKAGIGPNEGFLLERFEVVRYH